MTDGNSGRNNLFELDLLMLGQLDPEAAERVRRSAASDASIGEYLARSRNLRSRLTLAEMGLAKSAPSPRNRSLTWFRPSKAAWAMAAAVMAMGIGVWTIRTPPPPAAEYHVKGVGPGFRLLLGSGRIDAGGLSEAENGDTLRLAYRSPFPLFVQIWIQENGADPKRLGGSAPGKAWEAKTAWTNGPASLILEGKWTRQTVWVVWSARDFMPEQAGQAISAGASSGDVHASAFRLSKRK